MPEVADALSRLTGENKDILLDQLRAMTNKDEIKQQIYEMEALKGDSDAEDNGNKGKASEDADEEYPEEDE
jgi:hypothetical protein